MIPKSLLFYIFEHKKIDSSVCQPIFELEISAVMNDLVRQVYTFRLLECCPFLVNEFSARKFPILRRRLMGITYLLQTSKPTASTIKIVVIGLEDIVFTIHRVCCWRVGVVACQFW